MTPHGEKGHLNVLVKDQNSDATGYGQHNRLIVYGSRQSVTVREDIRWDLPYSTETQRKKVYMGWARLHPRGTRLAAMGSERFGDSIFHDYTILKKVTK